MTPHYNSNIKGIDVISFSQAYDLNFNKGNIVKYLVRAGKKPGNSELKDLEKAMSYLEAELNYVKEKLKLEVDEKRTL